MPAEGVFVYQAAQLCAKMRKTRLDFFVFFMLVMPFNFDAQVVGNDISTLNTMTITPSSNVRLQNTHICLPAYLLYPSDTIWPTNLEHLSLYGSLHFATCPLGNARKLVLYSIY